MPAQFGDENIKAARIKEGIIAPNIGQDSFPGDNFVFILT